MSLADMIMSKGKDTSSDADSDAPDESAGEDNAELEVASNALMDAMKSRDTKAFAAAFKDMLNACNESY